MGIKKMIFFSVILKLTLLFVSLPTFAQNPEQNHEQNIDDQDIINVENIYKPTPPSVKPGLGLPKEQSTSNPLPSEPSESDTGPGSSTSASKEELKQIQEQIRKDKIERLTDLNRLAPFREVSIIQKKYLPKTGRFQIYAAGGMTTNSPWFANLGAKLNIGYFFTETFGVEVGGIFLSNSERDVAKEIRENNNLQPEKFVNTKSHVGGSLVWSPIYGKLSFINDRIIPFDMYFLLGAGTSSTNSKEKQNTTFHIGTGQMFALGKGMALRWDYTWNMYKATPEADASLASGASSSNTYNDLILTAGISFFFPEVSNR